MHLDGPGAIVLADQVRREVAVHGPLLDAEPPAGRQLVRAYSLAVVWLHDGGEVLVEEAGADLLVVQE